MIHAILITGQRTAAVSLKAKLLLAHPGLAVILFAQPATTPPQTIPINLVQIIGTENEANAVRVSVQTLAGTHIPVQVLPVSVATTPPDPTTPTPDGTPLPTPTLVRMGYIRTGASLTIVVEANVGVEVSLSGRNGTVWTATESALAVVGDNTAGGLTYNRYRTYASVPAGNYRATAQLVGSEAAPTTLDLSFAALPSYRIGYRRDGVAKSLEIFALVPDTDTYVVTVRPLSGTWSGTSERTLVSGSYTRYGVAYNRQYQYVPGFAGGIDVPDGNWEIKVYKAGQAGVATTATVTLTSQTTEGDLVITPPDGGSSNSGTTAPTGTDDATPFDEAVGSFN